MVARPHNLGELEALLFPEGRPGCGSLAEEAEAAIASVVNRTFFRKKERAYVSGHADWSFGLSARVEEAR